MTSLRTLVSSSRQLFTTTTPAQAVRSFATTRTRTASSSLPPPLPHHAHPSTLEPPQNLSETSSVPDEVSALSLLKSQPTHYVSALLMGRRYLLTPNDILTVPHLKSVPVGTKISLTRILEVGSRDYTLRASFPSSSSSSSPSLSRPPILTRSALTSPQSETPTIPRDWQRHPDSLPYLSTSLVQAELTVVEHTKGEMFQVDKFKRRKGYRRSLRSKLGFTKLRMGEIKLQ
ncbi:mitochondrial 54S ribosomal protein bL21m MRPL49 [Sporobolomyces salmoneus]|uniref:mitochondrial 54S ribosomal protein bL21m MRPL49 n=1 Tax=Sporobolomyces salmoneus TaxID=183962 RepID=UPI00317B8841